jgi:hypothetical protein
MFNSKHTALGRTYGLTVSLTQKLSTTLYFYWTPMAINNLLVGQALVSILYIFLQKIIHAPIIHIDSLRLLQNIVISR